jgi:hypothetical protein
MIVIKVIMWPMGDESREREIARAYISNDYKTSRNTSGKLGSYNAKFMQSQQYDPKKIWKEGRAENINREKRGVWDILYLCLKSIGMDLRNKLPDADKQEGRDELQRNNN